MCAVVVDEKTDGVLLALACSDGAVRLVFIAVKFSEVVLNE